MQPPAPSAAALAELKHWLGITRTDDDGALGGLLETSLALCEAFTGKTPLLQVVEEVVPLSSDWHELASRPVRSLNAAELVAANGSRTPLAAADYRFEIGAAGGACVQLTQALEGRGVALQLTVGIADDWAGIPAPLKQGIIRLAAHHYRDRDGKGSAVPPASVTALWRPWRNLRLG